LVYDALRQLATAKLANENSGHTLQPTALVHEAYLRLVDAEKVQDWNSRGHFFMAAAEAMRRILVENARRKRQVARGGEHRRVPIENMDLAADAPLEELLALDESLGRLEDQDAASPNLVKLRYFAGMTMAQAAEALGISLRTAERNWTYARSWLRRDLH
jgi:RNA polymerase sigma factor (TIGR02999 family)